MKKVLLWSIALAVCVVSCATLGGLSWTNIGIIAAAWAVGRWMDRVEENTRIAAEAATRHDFDDYEPPP